MTTYEERKNLPIGGYDHGYDDAADAAAVASEYGPRAQPAVNLVPVDRLLDPEFWDAVASEVASDHTYDLSDSSHLMDIVQLVCEAVVRADSA